jgi:excisionase family DNA binding protein
LTTLELITTGHAAEIIGVSAVHVRRLADGGSLPAYSTPLGRLFDRAVVEAFARERAEAKALSAAPVAA